MGDMLGTLKGAVVNLVVRRVKKLVPAYALPDATTFNAALGLGHKLAFVRPEIGPDDIAFLQYTGGTTGVSKGAILLHRNLVANMLQVEAWHVPIVALAAADRSPDHRHRAAALSYLRADRVLAVRHAQRRACAC